MCIRHILIRVLGQIRVEGPSYEQLGSACKAQTSNWRGSNYTVSMLHNCDEYLAVLDKCYLQNTDQTRPTRSWCRIPEENCKHTCSHCGDRLFFFGYILTSTKGLLLSFHPPPTCQAVFVYLALVCAWRSKGIGCNEGRRNDPKFCSQIPAGVAGAGTSGGEVPLIVIVIDLVIQICLVYVTRSLAVNQQFPQSVFAYLSPNSASSSAKQQSSVPWNNWIIGIRKATITL